LRVEGRSYSGVQYQVTGFADINSNFHDLGFNHDGYVTALLVGDEAAGYVCNVADEAADWMSGSLGTIGEMKLRDICIPGSHDAGMSAPVNGSTVFGYASSIITQRVPIAQQLTLGARYFDIRPVTHTGQFYCGHCTGSQGGNGQSIADVISQVNAFTALHKAS